MDTNCYCSLQDKLQFNKWIVEQLGPVILGAKPSEILNFPTCNNLNDSKGLVEQLFKMNLRIGYEIFYPPKGCMKVLFYNRKILDEILRDKRNLKFLERLGYPVNYSLEGYLDILINKLKKGEMPHEIGIFLGYPLKDVIGFIGHPSLKLTKVNRWRVYGNPKLSDMINQRIVDAKKQIKLELEEKEPKTIIESAFAEDFLNGYVNSQYYLALCCYLTK